MYLRLQLAFFFLISFAILNEPFVFSQLSFIGREIRAFLGILTILLLFLLKTKFKFSELIFYFSIVIIILFEIIFQRSNLNNILSNYIILFIAFSLFRILREDKLKIHYFIKKWLIFSFILSIGAIISFVIHQFTNLDADILNFNNIDLFNPKYKYNESIFGFTINKNFEFLTLVRVCSFFKEPQYAGMFFAANMVIALNITKPKKNIYFISSLIAGLLTFSFTFYVSLIVKIKIIILIFCIVAYQLNYTEFVIDFVYQFSSFEDRFARMKNGVIIVSDSSILNLFFGNGINTFINVNQDDLGRSISSGFLFLFYEFGIFISFYILILANYFARNDLKIKLICLVYLLVFPWFKFIIMWYLIILCGSSYNIGVSRKFIFK